MSIVVAIALGLLSLAFVLYPLLHRTSGNVSLTTTPAEENTAPQEGEQTARTALQEVELDYQLGNISDSDYRALRERYLRRALVAMKSRYEHEQEIDEEIEEQLRKMRGKNEI